MVVDHNEGLLRRAEQDLESARVVANSAQPGLRGARNSGLLAASASFVAFLDDDAEADSRWLELLAGAYDDPEVAGVGGLTRPVWEMGRPPWFPREFDWVVGSPHPGMVLRRQEVRNLWGGNMSFRRSLVKEAGGFQMGYSCDDTELCIRLVQRWPRKRFVFAPEARVVHYIDGSRMSVRQFLRRCYFEGGSKAVLTQLVGSNHGLASERRYTLEVLPRGVKQGLSDGLLRRDPHGFARAGLIVCALASAMAGFGVGHVAPTRTAKKRGWSGGRLLRRPVFDPPVANVGDA